MTRVTRTPLPLRSGRDGPPRGRRPTARGLGVVAGTLGALSAGALSYLLRRPLPQLDGEVRLAGLNGQVEVVRDLWGIPHISAANEHDAFFAQGYCHAQDRLWQMEVNRRAARGQLAEVFGADALPLDRFIRRVGTERAGRADLAGLPEATRLVLEAYTAGVNAAIEGVLASGRLPVEYVLARFEPRRWDLLDTLAFGRYFAFTQSANWGRELMRARLIARLGYEAAAALEPDVWQPHTDAVPRMADWGPAELHEPPEAPLQVPPGGGGSNGWVVSGDRSTTGRPLLATDPHLRASLPGIWYEAHLTGGADLNVAGVSIPGVPGIGIGHNRHLAWGFTVSFADQQDFFVERVDPGDARRTEFMGRWEAGTLVRESIAVRGQARPWVEEVLITRRHGPLVTPTPALPDEHRPLALKSIALEAPESGTALLALNHARSWEEFRDAARQWSSPSFDAIYADVDGNIGHQFFGRVPIRARGEGLVPSPGWTGQYEWTGTAPFESLPSALNPTDGLWATANHDIGRGCPVLLSRAYDAPSRYRRIRQVLEGKDRHSLVDFGVLQADLVSLPSMEAAAILARRLRPVGALESQALDLLRRWDGRVSADSAAATILHVFQRHALRERYGEVLGDLLPVLYGAGPHPVFAAESDYYSPQMMRLRDWLAGWDAEDGDDADVDDVAHRAFTAAVVDLRGRLGPDPRTWRWGRLHTLRLRHSLSRRRPLGLLFDLPAVPYGGDLDTVSAGGEEPGGYDAGGTVSSYRLLVDLADWDQSVSSLPAGQSGHRGSPHYADQFEAWQRVAYHPLAFSRPAVLRHARHTLRLAPARDAAPSQSR